MSVIEELIRLNEDNTISFGNYLMDNKKKVLDFEVMGDLYKVKTFKAITKLEKNGRMLLESVPGSTVHNFFMDEKKVLFSIEGIENTQVTLELEEGKEYKIYIDNVNVGRVKTNMSGKINFSAELRDKPISIKIEKII